MAFTRILLDDNFALGKRRRDDFDDGAVAHSRSLSRIGKPSMTIKTGGFASGLPGTSLPSPPLDHEDHRIFNLVSCQRHDTPPPAKTRRKTVPASWQHVVVARQDRCGKPTLNVTETAICAKRELVLCVYEHVTEVAETGGSARNVAWNKEKSLTRSVWNVSTKRRITKWMVNEVRWCCGIVEKACCAARKQ
ncbi:hypothetical protein Vi05172_g870 [Venturia inaequalis]|nr:hypothetical protein Vi05172_g870 [Venturia inaequalis]